MKVGKMCAIYVKTKRDLKWMYVRLPLFLS